MAIEIEFGVDTNWVGAGFTESGTVDELFGIDDETWNSMTEGQKEEVLDEYAAEIVHDYAWGFARVVE